MIGNFVVQPTNSSPAIGIEITENDIKTDYTIKFDSNDPPVPVFFNSDGSTFVGHICFFVTLSME